VARMVTESLTFMTVYMLAIVSAAIVAVIHWY
jgi:hypothetical protein